MVRIINIECPHCQKHSEIYLSIDPNVIILNCPECGTPLILEDSDVKEVSRELDMHKPSIKDVLDAFKNRNPDQYNDKEFIPDLFKDSPHYNKYSSAFENSVKYPLSEIISDDDITNLKIDLSKVNDVKDLIENFL